MRYVIMALLCDAFLALSVVGIVSGKFSSLGSGFQAFGIAIAIFVIGLVVLVLDVVFSVMAISKNCMSKLMMAHAVIGVLILMFLLAGARL